MRNHINCPVCKRRLTSTHGGWGVVKESQGFPTTTGGEILRCRSCGRHWIWVVLPPDHRPTIHEFDPVNHTAQVEPAAELPVDWTGLPQMIGIPPETLLDLGMPRLAGVRDEFVEEVRHEIAEGNQVLIVDFDGRPTHIIYDRQVGLRAYPLPGYDADVI